MGEQGREAGDRAKCTISGGPVSRAGDGSGLERKGRGEQEELPLGLRIVLMLRTSSGSKGSSLVMDVSILHWALFGSGDHLFPVCDVHSIYLCLNMIYKLDNIVCKHTDRYKQLNLY